MSSSIAPGFQNSLNCCSYYYEYDDQAIVIVVVVVVAADLLSKLGALRHVASSRILLFKSVLL